MKVQSIQNYQNFKSSTLQSKEKVEFIDKLMNLVQNQEDVNDCVAVPRGIFKAYLWIMGGFGLIGIANALPAKMSKSKTVLAVVGNIMNMISAFYFAKPFAFKNVSPTVEMQKINRDIKQ